MFSSIKITILLGLFSGLLTPSGAIGAPGKIKGEISIAGAPAEEAVVFLTGAQPLSPSSGEVKIEQKEIAFKPSFVAVPVGTTLIFENNDKEMHTVKSDSPGNRFDIGIQNPGETRPVVVTRPGRVVLRCTIHPNMRGLAFVTPTPYFAVTDRQGRFHIDQVPAGSYRLEVWHRRLSEGEAKKGAQEVVIGADEVKTVRLNVASSNPATADLSGVEKQDWNALADQIGMAFDRALAQWKEDKPRASAMTLSTTHSRLYAGSGLRNVIGQIHGAPRAADYEQRLNRLMRQTQSKPGDPAAEAALRKEMAAFLADMKKDIKKLPQ